MRTFNFFIDRVFFLPILFVISLSMNLHPQIQRRVNLTSDKYEIQQWERVNIKASLNFNGINTSYRFLINNKQVTVGVNNNQIKNYEFKNTGTFTVKVLAKSNPNQEINNPTLTDSITIIVRKVELFINPPEVFTGDKVSIKLGYKLPENYVKYRFYFGDNSQSEWLNESITNHAYEHNGSYRVYAEIGKFDGATLYDKIQSDIKRIKVNIKPSFNVSLSAISYATVDQNITFTATPITNVPDQNFRFQFDFGDGTPEIIKSSRQIKHSYRNTGTYYARVRLIKSEEQVLATSESIKIIVKDLVIPEESVSLAVTPVEVLTNEEVKFKLHIQAEYGNLRYRFYYGAGLPPSPWLEIPESSYRYEQPDIYKVYAEVGRFDGDSVYPLVRSNPKQVKVNPYYKVNLSAKKSVQVDEIITFTALTSTNAKNNNFRYIFNFGDNTETTSQPEKVIDHSYTKTGTYNASVNLITSAGLLLAESNVVSINVQDLVIPQQSISLIVNPTEAETDEEVIFKLLLQNEYQNLKYRFHYGEGLQPGPWHDTPESKYSYQRSDTYEVFAEIGRFDGDSVYTLATSETKRVKVNPFIDVKLFAEPSANVDEEITFKAEAITNIENPDFRYLFDFGDSHYSEPQQENTAIHHYNKKGKYNASVKLLNARGKILKSGNLLINVDEPDNLLLYILIALGVLLGSSFMIKYLFTSKIKFTSHYDEGEQAMTKEKDNLIEMKIRINPNTSEAKFQLDIPEKKLLDKIRREK